LKSKINNVSFFVAVLKGITKITDKAHFDVSEKEIRIRSIDPLDLCYIDVKLNPSLFENYQTKFKEKSFAIEIGALQKVLATAKNHELSLEITANKFNLSFMDTWKTTYSLDWTEDEFNLPEPAKLSYDTKFTLSSDEFLKIVKEASYVSREICFKVEGNVIEISAEREGFSFNTKITKNEKLDDFVTKKKSVTAFSILDYLNTLSDIIKMCKEVTISLSEDMPLKMELSSRGGGKLVFIISNKKIDERLTQRKRSKKIQSRRPSAISTSNEIPNISVTKFPEYMLSLDNLDKIRVKEILQSIHETETGSYTRLTEFLQFIKKKGANYVVSETGKELINMLRNNSRGAKDFIHGTAQEKIPEYNKLLNELSGTPHDVNSIVKTFSFSKSKKSVIQNKDDILILLGLATWVNAVDRRLGMYYFEK